jgi:Icc-related predicted phosphoesterase
VRLLPLLLLLSACAGPQNLREPGVLAEVAARYRSFYPAEGDPDPARDAGLLRPRFGLPALAARGASFDLELLERGGPQPVTATLVRPGASPADGGWPLALSLVERTPIAPGVERARWAARADAPSGPYDLYVASPVDAPARAPRAVWLSDRDPAAPRPLRIAQLSDIHNGKGDAAEIEANLRRVIADVNQLAADLVIVTGDVVNSGGDRAQLARARALLETFAAPVLVVLGNHDLGFGTEAMFTERRGDGWPSFARSFHPYLYFHTTFGGWDFVGFDSGPSTPSPRVLTRGISDDTVADLTTALASAREQGRRGVVLFSHAPSRAVLASHSAATSAGVIGKMEHGGVAFERALLDAAERGQRVLHLAGHTHWSDVFEATPTARGLVFTRWPPEAFTGPPSTLSGRAALVTTQSATHSQGFKSSGRGFGFALIELGDGESRVGFVRHGLEHLSSVK